MKPQDIAFLIILIILIWRQSPKLSTIFGLVSLLLAIPLYAMWVFFSAQRLTWYAGAFLFLSLILFIRTSSKEKK